MAQKSFQELNLSNNFLFSAALEDKETCKLVLECILDCNITDLVVHTEHNILFNTDFKYIRLDVFGKDMLDISYNLEMQNKNESNLPLRSRYYQAELDLSNLKPGEDYTKLKPLYVIFICSFDPFGKNLYRYTFEMKCDERNFPLNDEVKRIFLNTKGTNTNEVPPTLVNFLGYLEESTDSYINKSDCIKVKQIHKKIQLLKKNRNLKERYMRFEELLMQRERKGYNQGIKYAYSEIFSLMEAMKKNGEEHLISRISEDEDFLNSKLAQYNIQNL